MATLNLDGNGSRRVARLYCSDYDESGTHGTPTDPALPDATYNRLIEELYLLYVERVEKRWQAVVFGSWTAGTTGVTGTATDIMELGRLSLSTYEVLERIEMHEWYAKMAVDPTTQGKPAFAAVQRVQTDTEADIGKWKVYVYPPANATYSISADVRKFPAAIGGTTGQPDISEQGCYILARLAAAKAAARFGEDPEFIDEILRDVPEHVMTAMEMSRLNVGRPRMREMEPAA